MTVTPDDGTAVRLSAVWQALDSGPPPTDVARLIDGYPGGAGGYCRDLEAAARAWVAQAEMTEAELVASVMAWVTSRAASAGEAASGLQPQAASG